MEVVRSLAQAGVPVGVLVSPLIPGLTDADLEPILERSAAAGVSRAGCSPWTESVGISSVSGLAGKAAIELGLMFWPTAAIAAGWSPS